MSETNLDQHITVEMLEELFEKEWAEVSGPIRFCNNKKLCQTLFMKGAMIGMTQLTKAIEASQEKVK